MNIRNFHEILGVFHDPNLYGVHILCWYDFASVFKCIQMLLRVFHAYTYTRTICTYTYMCIFDSVLYVLECFSYYHMLFARCVKNDIGLVHGVPDVCMYEEFKFMQLKGLCRLSDGLDDTMGMAHDNSDEYIKRIKKQ